MAPEATLMIHDVSSWAVGKVGKMKIGVKEAKRLNKRIYRIMEKNIGKKKGYLWSVVEKMNREDWYITAKKAVEHGLANHIGTPSMTVSVSVNSSLRIKK
jgi:ATP-dependent protease ClpP protease subunit